MSGPAVAGVEGRLAYTIAVPASWYELDLEPATRADSIRRLVEDRTRGDDAMWEQRRGLERLLLEQAQAARESGATYCASFSMPTDEGPVTGTVTVSLVMDPAADEPSILHEAFRPVERREGDLTPYTDVSTLEVGGRRCVRSQGIEDAALGDGHYVRNVSMLTAVPVPEHGRVFLVACSSPVVVLADQLLDLFDAVSGTFRVVLLEEGE